MIAPESRSGLEPWKQAELPEPPQPKGLQWMGVVGPGVIVLGASIGSGEYLLGPANFVKYGLTLLWVTSVAVLLQTNFNAELMRYTMATGEPANTGFMRTRPHSTFWAVIYSLLYFLQVGWPGWAGAASGAFFFLVTKRVAGPEDAGVVYMIGVATFLLCVAILLVGRRIERTLEILNWILVIAIIGSFLVLALLFVAPSTWIAAATGFFGFAPSTGKFMFLPEGADYFLIGAFAGFCGAGGVINLTLSNWARDKGYGMGGVAGYIPAAVGGKKVNLAHSGFTFVPDEKNMARWRGWWRVVKVDQWIIYFIGAMLGMALPALLYVTFLEPGLVRNVPRSSPALIDVHVDIFETCRALMQIPYRDVVPDGRQRDGISFLGPLLSPSLSYSQHLRQFSFAYRFVRTGDGDDLSARAGRRHWSYIRHVAGAGTYKLISRNESHELYRIRDDSGGTTGADPFELSPLDIRGAWQTQYESVQTEAQALLESEFASP
jgi:hypothetical protein